MKPLYYIIIYYIIWYIFDGCPLTHVTPIDETNTDNDAFILQIFRRYINSNATTEQVNLITNLILTLAIVISAYKVIYKEFVSKTTLDTSTLVKRWKTNGTLERLLQMDKK